MNVGIAYDVKEDYCFSRDDWSHSDFTTLAEVSRVKTAIEACGHRVNLLGNFKKIVKLIEKNRLSEIDLVFNMSEGIHQRSREGWVPSLLEVYGIPYTGTDAYGLNLSLNKLHTKLLASHLSINTPAFFLIDQESDLKEDIPFSYPCILKPNYEGSSSGITLAHNSKELSLRGKELLEIYEQPILCEQYIEGREFTVSLLGEGSNTEAVGIIETIRKNGTPIGVFSNLDKHYGRCDRILPKDLHESIKLEALNSAIKLHLFIGCQDYNRVDYRLDKHGKLYFLETNPLPALTETSAFPVCCELHGLLFHEVIDKIILGALSRYNKKNPAKRYS